MLIPRILPVLLVSATASAQCPPGWSDQFGSQGPAERTSAAVVFDEDGPGPRPPALFVGCAHLQVGDTVIRGVARWDGQGWSAVGNGLIGTPSALFVHDPDGAGPALPLLLAGGSFSPSGDVVSTSCAAWDGARWRTYGGQFLGRMQALAEFDRDGPGPIPSMLYAAGQWFDGAGTYTTLAFLEDGLDGSEWQRVATSPNGTGAALAVFDEDGAGPGPAKLFVAGTFHVEGQRRPPLRRFDGFNWSDVIATDDHELFALLAADIDGAGPTPEALYIAGYFDIAGGSAETGVRRWNGTSLSSITGSMQGSPYALSMVDDDGPGPRGPSLMACGSIFINGGRFGLARFTGTSWAEVPGSFNHITSWIAPFDPEGPQPWKLYVGGYFALVDNLQVSRIAAWNGAAWSAVGPVENKGLSDSVQSLAVFDTNGDGAQELIVGGNFLHAAGQPMVRIAAFNGQTWSQLGSGFNSTVEQLFLHDADGAGPNPPALHARGRFSASGSTSTGPVARWTGAAWAPVIPGIVPALDSIYSFDEDGAGPNPPFLFAGGNTFTVAGFQQTRGIARWNGLVWSALGQGLSGTVRTMVAFDDDGPGPNPAVLIAGGSFSFSGSTPMLNVARWNGTAWTALGQGLDREVRDLLVFDADGDGPGLAQLYAAGSFSRSGSANVAGVARWTGTAWQQVGAGLNSLVYDMAVWDRDGAGPGLPQLCATGAFSRSGNVTVVGVAALNGTQWQQLGTGAPSSFAASEFDDDGPGPRTPSLFVGGLMGTAGGLPAMFFSRYGPVADTTFVGPAHAMVYTGGDATFGVTPTGAEPRTFRWRRHGAPLSNGSTGTGSTVIGADTATLTIQNAGPDDAAAYDVIVSNSCGDARSGAATLTLVPRCSVDFNADGDVGTDADIEAFLACLGGHCCAVCGDTDFNNDGSPGTDADIESFFRALAGNGC